MRAARALAAAAWLIAAAAALIGGRPARLRSARVTAVSPGQPPVAHVALRYGAGLRPVSLVLTVRGPGCVGSVTTHGSALFAEVPLEGAPHAPLTITALACYARPAGQLLREQRF